MAKANLGPIVSDVRGTVGQEVLTRGRTGEVLRRKPRYKYPKNPTLAVTHDRMKAVMQAWNTLDRAQALAWNAYAATLTRHNPVSGETYRPTGQNVFVALATKFLQLHPADAVPLTPPAAPFPPDSLQVTVAGVREGLLFTASAPNTPLAVTELLVQPLANARRAPGAFYKSAAFVSFVGRAPDYRLALPSGWYACAFRFVHARTGQATEIVTLDAVQVP
jgi:hypothetical protein